MRDTHHRRPLGRRESGLLPPPSSPSLPTHSLPGASCHTPSASQQQRIPNKQDRCMKHASHLSQILERFSGVPTHARCVNYCMSAFITLNVMMMAASGECLCRSACTRKGERCCVLTLLQSLFAGNSSPECLSHADETHAGQSTHSKRLSPTRTAGCPESVLKQKRLWMQGGAFKVRSGAWLCDAG